MLYKQLPYLSSQKHSAMLQEHVMRPNSYIMGHPIVPLMASLFQVPFQWKHTGTGLVCVIWLQIKSVNIKGVLLSSLCLQNGRRHFIFYMYTCFNFFFLHIYLIFQKVFLINLHIHMLKKPSVTCRKRGLF